MKNGIVIIFFFLMLNDSKAQNQSIIPPSPVSAEFAKYITHEVSLYNGIPEISIPLYTIQLKGLTIPISLSYHASGIKFRQNDGSVGVGWVLNPGYRISRSVYGYPDEFESMPSDILSILSNLDYEAGFGSSEAILKRDLFLSRFVPGGDFKPYESNLDGEFDQFIFSTPGPSGGFIISDRVNRTVSTTEYSNLKVSYKTGQTLCTNFPDGIKGFQIIDEAGNKYSFGEYNPQDKCNVELASASGINANTAWGMAEIITPAGEEVKFKYIIGSPYYPADHVKSLTIREANSWNCLIPTIDTEQEVGWTNGYSAFYTSEIITRNEKIIINYDAGIKVKKIEVFSSENVLIKSIEFSYSQTQYHVFLDKVSILDSKNNEIEKYKFDYYSKDTTAAFSSDHYGYYLQAFYPNLFYHQEFLDDPILVSHQVGETCEIDFSRRISDFLTGKTISREPHPSFASDYFSLKKITYPTGGYTEFEYEPGRYADVGSNGPVRAAGIRIKSIKSYDLNSNEPMVRNFTYGENENGFGETEFWTGRIESLFVNEKVEMNFISGNSVPSAQRIITYSTTMQGDVGPAFNETGFVKYPCVTEYYSENPQLANGKNVYHFKFRNQYDISTLSSRNNPPLEVYSGTHYIINYRQWDKPRLERKVVYTQRGGDYIPVYEEVYDYAQSCETFSGLKVEQSAVLVPGSVLSTEFYTNVAFNYTIKCYFNYSEYTFGLGRNLLKKKTEIQYLDDQKITTERAYDYSNFLPSRESIIRSTGDTMISYTSYPLDYATGTSFIDDMKMNGLIGYPLEKVDYLESGSDIKVLSGTLNIYKPGGRGFIESQWSTENKTPVSLNTFKFSNRASGILPPEGTAASFSPDGIYAKKVTYDNYDSKGNILQLHKENDISVTYLWGYNNTYPVAKIENAYLQDVENALGGSIPDLQGGGLSSDQNNALRTGLQKAMVTTYTYKILTGMTSQTDPNGVTTYYEYDSFGRLKIIKDNEGRILKTFEYNYSH
jgi:YD repeat-containing protein